jgi:oligo-1,6-glucosidase
MTNAGFAGIDDFRDIESLDHYARAVGTHHEDASVVLDALRRTSRDNARTPMQWSAAAGAGFTTGSPWIGVNPNHSWLNVSAQRGVRGSIYEHYRALIALRHRLPVVVDGHFAAIDTGRDQIYAFRRQLGDTALTVYANLSDLPVSLDRDDRLARDLVLANYPGRGRDPDRLEPWEVRVYVR